MSLPAPMSLPGRLTSNQQCMSTYRIGDAVGIGWGVVRRSEDNCDYSPPFLFIHPGQYERHEMIKGSQFLLGIIQGSN